MNIASWGVSGIRYASARARDRRIIRALIAELRQARLGRRTAEDIAARMLCSFSRRRGNAQRAIHAWRDRAICSVPFKAFEAALLRADRAESDLAAARSDNERSADWFQQRFNALRKWVNEEVRPLSAEAAERYFAIVANGSPSPLESADWTETLHSAQLGRQVAEDRLVRANEDLAAARRELAEIKARRCDACAHGTPERGKISCTAGWHDGDWFCADWSPKEKL